MRRKSIDKNKITWAAEIRIYQVIKVRQEVLENFFCINQLIFLLKNTFLISTVAPSNLWNRKTQVMILNSPINMEHKTQQLCSVHRPLLTIKETEA